MPHLHLVVTEASMAMGGQELAVVRQAEGLSRRGHRVSLLLRPSSPIEQLARKRGLPVHAIEMPGLQVRTLRTFRDILLKHKPDLLHVNSSRDSWLGALTARMVHPRVKVIKSRHISAPLNHNVPTRILYRRLFDHVIVTGGPLNQRLLIERDGLAPNRVDAFPIGVDLRRFSPGKPDTDLRLQLGLDANQLLVGLVSYLRSYKGHVYFLDAAAQLAAIEQATLVIVGEGPEEGRIRAAIAERGLDKQVRMLGYAPDLLSVLRSLDVFVAPSVEGDTIPQVLIEAMATGLPVVSTTTGSIPDIVRDGETGFVVSPRDAHALACRIEDLLADHDLRQRLGRQAHELVTRCYSLDTMLDRLEAVYQRVLDR